MNTKILGFVLACCFVLSQPGRAEPVDNVALAPHAADFVVLKEGKLVPLRSEKYLRTPYTVVYFGAGWCPDCRRFSPALVQAYNHQPAGSSRFEVLLMPMDKSSDGMSKFMQIEHMPWPALAFDKAEGAVDLKKYYSGKGIPCLTVIDPKGAVVLQSKTDQDANGVLQELGALLKQVSPSKATDAAASASAPGR